MAISKQQRMTPLSSSRRHETNSQITYDELNNIIDRGLEILNDDYDLSEVDSNDETDSRTSSQSSSGPQRAINFSAANKVYEIMSLEEYTEKELRRCWYSAEEKEKMNNSKDKVVARLEAGKKPRSDMTYRGLECWTTQGGQELDENIARAVNAVMDEQDRQWALNCDDWDKIASISAAVTVDSGKVAHQVAIADEKEAKLAQEIAQDLSAASQHSIMSESVCSSVAPRNNLFDVLMKKRCASSTKAKRREASIEESSTKQDETTIPDHNDARRKSKKSKSSSKKPHHKKSSRRNCVDPPAPVNRSASQKSSEILLKMVSAGRELSSLKA